MSTKIPVTVITGFLGSGKTTTIRHLLQNNQGRRIAVLVNEFGEVGIDGELLRSCQVCDEEDTIENIVELTNGCLCCTVQEEFFPTMQQLLKRREKIDSILIETSGLALPKPLVQAFRWPEIRTGATVDGVVTVVDCEAVANGSLVGDINALEAQRKADPNLDHETPIEELFEDQLACADLVLLTKLDRVDQNTRDQVQNWLKQQLPERVKIVPCIEGKNVTGRVDTKKGLYTISATSPDNSWTLGFWNNHGSNNKEEWTMDDLPKITKCCPGPQSTLVPTAILAFFFGQPALAQSFDSSCSCPVPEPLTILGSVTALGIGALVKREHSKNKNKSDL